MKIDPPSAPKGIEIDDEDPTQPCALEVIIGALLTRQSEMKRGGAAEAEGGLQLIETVLRGVVHQVDSLTAQDAATEEAKRKQEEEEEAKKKREEEEAVAAVTAAALVPGTEEAPKAQAEAATSMEIDLSSLIANPTPAATATAPPPAATAGAGSSAGPSSAQAVVDAGGRGAGGGGASTSASAIEPSLFLKAADDIVAIVSSIPEGHVKGLTLQFIGDPGLNTQPSEVT